MDFVCPICKGELTPTENLIKKCPLGHSFDRARAGYYNLLVGQSGGTHGDNREMVDARRAFLSGDYYSPLANRVAELALEHTEPLGTVLDIGCGEGYYSTRVASMLQKRDGTHSLMAFDISKDAVKRLLARDKTICAAVASAYDMPIATGTVDTALLVFSPLAREEIYRVLREDGKLIMVFPDVMHLYGLKEKIYDTPYKNKPEPTELSGFSLISDEALSYEITVEGEMIKNLFMMTPYAYRTSEANKARLFSNETITTEVAFRILVYRKV